MFAEFHPWQSPLKVGGHHYAEHFAEDGWRVLWLANFLNLNRLIRQGAYDKLYLQSWKNGICEVRTNIFTYTAFPLIPYLDMPVLSSLSVARNSLKWCIPSLKHQLSSANFLPLDVLWISQPRMYSLVQAIPHRKLVYRMFDDVRHFAGEPTSITKVEEWLCREADVVFATSKHLVTKASQFSSNVIYLPNGADVNLFHSPALMPEEFENIPHPRLVYVGAIAEWFDFDFLFEIAALRPDWSFVLVGPLGSLSVQYKERFSQYKNIHYLGPKPPNQIPGFMQHSDLGIIPFQLTDLTHSVSPIKLFEYCAAGLPTLAPKMKEIEGYNIPILFYSDGPEFIRKVEEGLRMRADFSGKIADFIMSNSWTARYLTIKDALS